jgi:hypothetical protein
MTGSDYPMGSAVERGARPVTRPVISPRAHSAKVLGRRLLVNGPFPAEEAGAPARDHV